MVMPDQWKPAQLASEEMGEKMVAVWSLTIGTLIIFETGLRSRKQYHGAQAVGIHGSASSQEEASIRLGPYERALRGAQQMSTFRAPSADPYNRLCNRFPVI